MNLIKSFEGMVLHPYLDSKKIPTIGIGTIRYPNGVNVTMSDPAITEAQALEYCQFHLVGDIEAVSNLVKVNINDNQFGALVSFCYNLGVDSLRTSSLLRDLNAGNISGAAEEFLKWNHAGGITIAGLTRRRQAERALFLHPVS